MLKLSETGFFCDINDSGRLSSAFLYVCVDGCLDSEGEEVEEVFVLAYGYSGAQSQFDFLFKRHSTNGLWYYTDSSGGEWKGARTYPKNAYPLYTEEVAGFQGWSQQDLSAQQILEGLWEDYFYFDENEEVAVLSTVLDQLDKNETTAYSEGFDMDVLWDVSPITNFTAQYSDPDNT